MLQKYTKWLIFSILFFACGKDKTVVLPEKVVVRTLEMSGITAQIATATGSLKPEGKAAIKSYGHCWSDSQAEPTPDNSPKTNLGAVETETTFTSQLKDLKPNTSYYLRAYAFTQSGTYYGDVITFKTSDAKAPVVITGDASAIRTTAFAIAGQISEKGTTDITQHGHVISETNQTPTTADGKTENGAVGSVPKGFSSGFAGLKANTVYYVRAYAINASATAYGATVKVTTKGDEPPTVLTGEYSGLTQTKVILAGKLTADGTQAVFQHGHCISETNKEPTIADTKTENGVVTASKDFTSSLQGLAANTTYYYRAYARSGVGVAYGAASSFKTSSTQPPVVTTNTDATDLTPSSFRLSGRVTDVGTSAVTQFGHVISENNPPTLANSVATTQMGTTDVAKDFTSAFGNLKANTTYYVRGYAVNAVGTAYSSTTVTVKTSNLLAPDITTGTVSNVGTREGAVTGRINAVGSSNVTQYGHCWGLNDNPTINDTKTQLGAATAAKDFSSTMTNLNPNTKYVVRAYATSSVGTSYGDNRTFTTANITLPTVETSDQGSITTTSFAVFANLSNVGGAAVTQHGFCWSSTNNNPTIADNKNQLGGTATAKTYNSNITALAANTTYYVKAYATNDGGTSYGKVLTIKTNPVAAPTIAGTFWYGIYRNGPFSDLDQTAQAHGIAFNADGTFDFYQRSGSGRGTWTLNGTALKLVSANSGINTTATFQNNTISGIVNNDRTLINSMLLYGNNLIALDNTTWTFTLIGAGVGGAIPTNVGYDLKLLPNKKFSLTNATGQSISGDYTLNKNLITISYSSIVGRNQNVQSTWFLYVAKENNQDAMRGYGGTDGQKLYETTAIKK
jgi:hypothetical protein